jgi:hypothetical protein
MGAYIPMTAKRANYPHRNYGYVVKINPPIPHEVTGQDVEGIGWVPCTPFIHRQHFHGWYKYKCDAIKYAEEMNKSLVK